MWDDREQLASLLGGCPLRAYHATRLLPAERDSVLSDGLRPLTADHIVARLEAALEAGLLGQDEYAALMEQQVFAPTSGVHRSLPGRVGKVCVVAGLASVNRHGLGTPLSTWGGEGIYMAAAADDRLRDRLQTIGTPSVVVMDVVLTAERIAFSAGVLSAFAANLNGAPEGDGEVHVRGPVAPGEIVAIWQPGMPEYDALPGLPR